MKAEKRAEWDQNKSRNESRMRRQNETPKWEQKEQNESRMRAECYRNESTLRELESRMRAEWALNESRAEWEQNESRMRAEWETIDAHVVTLLVSWSASIDQTLLSSSRSARMSPEMRRWDEMWDEMRRWRDERIALSLLSFCSAVCLSLILLCSVCLYVCLSVCSHSALLSVCSHSACCLSVCSSALLSVCSHSLSSINRLDSAFYSLLRGVADWVIP